MGMLTRYADQLKRRFFFTKLYKVKLSKGNDCHYFTIVILPSLSIHSCRSNFLDRDWEIIIEWLVYRFIWQITYKRRLNK